MTDVEPTTDEPAPQDEAPETDFQDDLELKLAEHRPSASSYDTGWHEALTWVKEELYPDVEEEDEGEVDEAQAERDRRHEAAAQGVEPEALDEQDEANQPTDEEVANAPDQEPPPDETPADPFNQ